MQNKAPSHSTPDHDAAILAVAMQQEYICVWKCRSVDGKQVVTVTHPMHPDDRKFSSEYQRIVYRIR